MKDALGREIYTIDTKPPSVPNLPVKIGVPGGTTDGWMNGNTAVITTKK